MRRSHHLGRADAVRAAAEEMGRAAGLRGCRGIAAKAAAILETDSEYILSSALDDLELQVPAPGRVPGPRQAQGCTCLGHTRPRRRSPAAGAPAALTRRADDGRPVLAHAGSGGPCIQPPLVCIQGHTGKRGPCTQRPVLSPMCSHESLLAARSFPAAPVPFPSLSESMRSLTPRLAYPSLSESMRSLAPRAPARAPSPSHHDSRRRRRKAAGGLAGGLVSPNGA